MSTQFLKPKPGRKITDPATGKRLPAKGAEVEYNSFWRRRVRDKDVTVPPKKKPAAKKAVAKPDKGA